MSDVESSGSRRPSLPGLGLGGKVAKLLIPGAGSAKKIKQDEKFFNPEEDLLHKREWALRQAQPQQQTVNSGEGGTPGGASAARLFEHFCIVGLHPELNVKAVSADIRTYQTARQAGGAGMDAIVRESSTEGPRQYGLKGHAYPAEVIYSYPERTMPPDLASSVAAFCCPHGVRPELLERTPSMSSLNEVIYGQPYQDAPDHSFVFMMQVSDPGDAQPRPMYGVCCYARELVHRPPAIARDMFPDATAPLSRYTVAAPRCYCLLTRLPFFSLHFRLLHTLLGLERLDRMTVYAEEVALGLAAAGHFSSPSRGVTSEAPEVEEEQGQVGRTAGAFESYTNTEGSSTSAGSSTHGGYGEDTQHQHLAASRASQDEAATPLPEPNSRQASDAQLLSSALSPAQSTSSYGSELATPSAPLLAASTPFFTPLAPNNTTVRRVTRHHGAPSPLVPPQPGPAFDDATSLLGRLDSVQKLLDDSLVEVDHRLAASPLVKGAVHDPRPDTSAPLISETSEAESYATALQSAGASSSDMGAWVGADEAESGQSRPVEPTGLSAQQADSDSVADAMAEVLTLESGIAGTAAKANGTSAPVSPASKAMSRSSTMGRDDVVTTSPLDHDGDLGTLTPGSQASTTDNGNVLRITAPDVDPSKPLQGGDLLRLYMGAQVPRPGQVLLFQPDPVLQAMVFRRADVADTLRTLGLRCDAAALPDVEAAQYLGPWAIATLCRCMSVDNILSYLSAALLERQVVVFCPNVGLLTGIVFSLVPALLPFTWHSLMLPVLPAAPPHLDLLDAPVPFVMGVVYKTPDIRSRCGGLVRVNVYKDRIKNAGALPALPQQAALADALAGAHAEIRRMGQSRAAETRPVHVVSDAQQVLANCFLSTLQTYLKGLVADLKGYTITDVTAGGGDTRVSVLLKDSFVESFPPRDRPFMRQFAETQMFSMYCDSVI